MGKPYRPCLPEQDFLLPPSPGEWLPEGHSACFVSDVVDELDLSAGEAVHGDEQRGRPPRHPRMMTKLLARGYCVGMFSSRRIQRRVAEDIAFRALAAGNEPDFRTILDFRKIHPRALEGLSEQVLKIAPQAGAIQAGRVALDGVKVKANAGKRKAMSYGRMEEKEKQLREEVKGLPARAEAADAEEDARYGNKQSAEDLPAELQRREMRMKRIREAKRELQQRAREKAAVEPNFQLIGGRAVTQATNDKQQVEPNGDRQARARRTGRLPAGTAAAGSDAGRPDETEVADQGRGSGARDA